MNEWKKVSKEHTYRLTCTAARPKEAVKAHAVAIDAVPVAIAVVLASVLQINTCATNASATSSVNGFPDGENTAAGDNEMVAGDKTLVLVKVGLVDLPTSLAS